MVMDRNPSFAADARFAEGARRVADLLWENTGGDLSAFPRSYLENLRHDYADGRVSMLELMDRVDLGPDATYEEYCEVFDALLEVDPQQWPNPESVVEVQTDKLLYQVEPVSFSESEFDFAEDGEAMSTKVEKFLRKVISSVYVDGVTDVTDAQGDPPGESNNYLLSDDGTEFHGVFHDKGSDGKVKEFPFRIVDNGGRWSIEY
jgi:hypothetical protein